HDNSGGLDTRSSVLDLPLLTTTQLCRCSSFNRLALPLQLLLYPDPMRVSACSVTLPTRRFLAISSIPSSPRFLQGDCPAKPLQLTSTGKFQAFLLALEDKALIFLELALM
ncbi:hypothetical protein M9458_008979, partial [Cirrhinus mrigala]